MRVAGSGSRGERISMRQYVKQRKWKLVLQVEEVGSGSKQRPKQEELPRYGRGCDQFVVRAEDRVIDRSVTLLENER
jgi:hypothetical protein